MPEWHGYVTDVEGDIFTAMLRREGQPELCADFSMRECGITVELGHLIVVTPNSVKLLDLGVWTQEEIDAIKARAKERAQRLGFTEQPNGLDSWDF